MNLDKKNLGNLLADNGEIFIVPLFQRSYKWDESRWEDLFDDIIRLYDNEDSHFMGSLVLQDIGVDNKKTLVIDGQQRLTTLSLLLIALAKYIKINNVEQYLYETTIKNRLIATNSTGSNNSVRIILSNKENNNSDYKILINNFFENSNNNFNVNSDLSKCYNYYLKKIENYFNEELGEDVSIKDYVIKLYDIVSIKLKFVIIRLDKDEDPNMIFETLNTRGTDLEDGDLVRNFIFMQNIENIENIYNDSWDPLEKYFESNDITHTFSDFLKYFLYANQDDAKTIKNQHFYTEIKKYLTPFMNNDSLPELLKNISNYKNYFDIIINPNSINKYSKNFQNCLNIFIYSNSFVYTPVFLKLIDLIENNKIDKNLLETIMQLISSYALRLIINGKKAPNKLIPELVSIITSYSEKEEDEKDENDLLLEIESAFHRQKSSPFYNDERFIDFFIHNSVYTKKKGAFIKFILLLIIGSNSEVAHNPITTIDNLTLEHIFPQKSNLWNKDLSEEEISVIKNEYLNTFGNLTLVTQKLNIIMSNNRFNIKKEKLNAWTLCPDDRQKYFSENCSEWNKDTIISRSEDIARKIIEIFPGPKLKVEDIKTNFNVIIGEETVKGKNQKNVYIATIEKLHEYADNNLWRSLNIKGCALQDKQSFSKSQITNIIEIDNIFITYHASMVDKIKKIEKISRYLNIAIEINEY